MMRTFRTHYIRKTQLLDGPWDFLVDPEDVGRREGWERRFPETAGKLYVPACWNNELGLFEYEGVAWYRTTVHTDESASDYRLVFHAILGAASVYVDGELAAEHDGGFTPIEVYLENVPAGPHDIVVRTDSSLGEDTLPYKIVDWYHYGGITRSVEWQPLPSVSIAGMKLTYALGDDGAAAVRCEVATRGEAAGAPLRVELDGEPVWTGVAAGGGLETIEFAVPNARLWNVGAPELYTVRAVLAADDWIDRIGFRTVATGPEGLLVNGAPVYLLGVNRHEEHPDWGFAMPPKLMHKELDILKTLGCNAVRGSHYPQSPYWLDLLDENGLLYWGEIPIWGAHLPLEATASPVMADRAAAMLREMIRRDRHHPCVVMWGIHNEIDTRSEIACKLSERLIEAVRSEDRTRPIIYATMHPEEDIVLPLADLVGINKYYGWYGGNVEDFEGMLERFFRRLETLGLAGKPVFMSEFGAAGVFGETGWEPRIFSEEYQADVLEKALRIFRAEKRISGTFVWQFADIRVNTRNHHIQFRDRARSFNNKGLVNEYRKPKTAFRTVQRLYREFARPT